MRKASSISGQGSTQVRGSVLGTHAMAHGGPYGPMAMFLPSSRGFAASERCKMGMGDRTSQCRKTISV